MGALANASALRHDATFREWVETAAVYQARQVITEATSTADHAIRLRLAQDVAVAPSTVRDLFVALIATDPDVATKGATPDIVGESLVIQKVANGWTTVAHLTYPNG